MEWEMFVICYNPSDYPGKFTVRRHIFNLEKKGFIPQDLLGAMDTLDQARELIPWEAAGPIYPHPDDDPVIVESYI